MTARRAFALVALGILLDACGATGTTSRTASRADTTTPQPAPATFVRAADSARAERSAAIKRARARKLARARAVAGVVRAYYADVDSKQLRRAWARLSPAVRSRLGPYETWSAGQQGTVEVRTSRVSTTRVSPSVATVAVELRSTSVDVCARTVHQRFAGTWTLSRRGGRWVATDLHIAKKGGGTERTDFADCDTGNAPSPSEPIPSDPGDSTSDEPDYSAPPTGDPGAGSPAVPDDPSFCDTHDCIPNYDNGRGSTVQCEDGTYSRSGGIQGACSHHGGVR